MKTLLEEDYLCVNAQPMDILDKNFKISVEINHMKSLNGFHWITFHYHKDIIAFKTGLG